MKRIIVFYIACILMAGLVFGQIQQATEKLQYSDNLRDPVIKIIEGEKANEIKRLLDYVFIPCTASERKKAEQRAIELLSGYELTMPDSVESECVWSAPLKFQKCTERKAIFSLLHSGTGGFVSFWIVHEYGNKIKCFSFRGSTKPGGYWQICRDLNGDKEPEIINRFYVGSYGGALTSVFWNGIYRWNGENYIRSDREFPEYYEKEIIPRYKKLLEEMKTWGSHIDENEVRNVYNQCCFFLEKARSIVDK